MKWSEIRKFRGPIWFIILGTMIAKASFFVSMPYLALRMRDTLGLDPVQIGLVLGTGPFIGIFAGFYIGYLSDQWGRRTIFISAELLAAVAFLGFAFATQTWHFAALNTLLGLCNAASHPVSAALISDLAPADQRKSAYQLRYFAINVGATFGPLAGAWLLLRGASLGFLITSASFFLFGLACFIWIPSDSRKPKAKDERATFGETMAAISSDRPLLYYTLAFIFMGMTYAQLESTMPQHLKDVFGDSGVRLFGLLMGVNALTVVTTQIPLTWATSRMSLIGTVKLGSLIYGLGFMIWAFVGHGDWSYSLGMVVLTMGEVLIFSNGNLVIDQIAPEKNKGAYFGASGLWALGSTIGPAFGGWLLMRLGGHPLYAVLGVLGMGNFFWYEMGRRAQKGRRIAAA